MDLTELPRQFENDLLLAMSNFLPFALPDIGEEEIQEVVHSLRSGWVTTGPKTKQFEEDFTAFLGGEVHAVSVNSATAGLHLALEALGIGPGDEVITTTNTFTATAEVVRYLGAHPVFVDIDAKTMNMDIAKVEQKITPKTKAIIPVHFAGLPCDMDPLFALAQKHHLKIVEDAAHSFPAFYKNQMIGQLKSDVTVFSFYATKTITTGEGGMVVTKNPEIASRMKVMRLHGISRDAFDRYTSNKPSWYYEIIAPGFKYNLTDLASSIGIHQLKKANQFQEKRQKMAERYLAELADVPVELPWAGDSNFRHAWHLFVLRLQSSARVSRDEFIAKMYERGIACSVHFIPLHLQPYWQQTYHLKPTDFPVAQFSFEKSVSIPIYTKMTEANQSRVIEAIRDILCG